MNLHSMLDTVRRATGFAAVTVALTLGACATPPTDPAARAEFDKTNDPLEPLNRNIFQFNLYADRFVLKPVAQTYQTVIPEPGRNSVRHFLDNLGEPIVFANDLLQGEFSRAHTTFARFLMNTTLGVGGVFDVATIGGLEKQTGDFGQTLYSWGVPDGPYLVLPIIGPSNPRDGIGLGVDGYADPFGHIASNYHYDWANYTRYVIDGIDQRARNIDTLDELQRHAIDFYAELRSLWRQHRAAELRHGEPAPIPDLDTLYNDPASKSLTSEAPKQPSSSAADHCRQLRSAATSCGAGRPSAAIN